MMAIAYRESIGVPYAECQDCLSKRRLSEVEELSGIREEGFRQAIRVSRGIHRGKVPKFLFDAAAFKLHGERLQKQGLNKFDAAMLCTGFGIALRFFTKEYALSDPHGGLLYLREFIASPDMQLGVLKNDLYLAGSRAGVAAPYPFERLSKEHYRRNDLAVVGGRTYGLSNYFRKNYEGVSDEAEVHTIWADPESEPYWRAATFLT